MNKLTYLLLLSLLTFVSCTGDEVKSNHPSAAFFYPFNDEAKIYVYRDVVGGLDEQFHRIYPIKDETGNHIIVERYSSDGRLLEALNFNMDSLNLEDHMVVNNQQKKTKATLYKAAYFPWNKKQPSWFASKYEGVMDSTLILQEIMRTQIAKESLLDVMGDETNVIKYRDKLKFTLINPFTKKEKELRACQISYYAEGFGLVEWKSENGSIHFKLEQILTQKDWLKIISR